MSLSTLDLRPQSLPLESLRNIVLGIDVQHYLNSILLPDVDPYYEAIGGFPLSLEDRILADAAVLESYGIKPIYVFPGLRSKSQFILAEQTSLLPYEEELKAKWESDNAPQSYRPNANSFAIRKLADQLLVILQENDLEYLISPYTQYHQLMYMIKSEVINCIYSSNDMLLLPDLENFIVKLDFNNKKFEFLNNELTIKSFGLTYAQFRDVSMATGNAFQPLKLIKESFESLADDVRSGLRNVYDDLASKSNDYKTFINGGAVLEYCPVLKTNGRVEQILVESSDTLLSVVTEPEYKKLDDKKEIPKGLNDLFGSHCPEEVYFYQSIGLNVFRLIEALDTQVYIERLPLDMTIDPVYEKLISSHRSMSLKESLFNYFSSLLHRYYQHRKIVQNTYYPSSSPTAKLPISKAIDYSQRNDPSLSGLLVRHGTARSFDFTSLVSNLNDSFLAESSHSNEDFLNPTEAAFAHLSSNYEVISTSILRTLFVYGFITSEKKDGPFKLTPLGHAFTKYTATHKSHIEVTLLLFILLQRAKDIGFNDICKLDDFTSLKAPEFTNVATLALITKLSTLYRITNWKDKKYTGPVSRPLLHFNSIMNVIHNEVRDFVVVHTLKLMFGNRNDVDKFNRDHSQWRSLATEIPYKSSMSNTVAGLMVQKSIETFVKHSSDASSLTSKLEEELACFNTFVANPMKEVKKILLFVSDLSDIADVLEEVDLVSKDVHLSFSAVKTTIAEMMQKL